MKSTFCSTLLLMSFIAIADPIDEAHVSQFKRLDPSDSKNRAALCVKLLKNIKKDTFAAARLREQTDTAALRQTSVTPSDLVQLKKLTDLLLFENSEYARYCTE